MPLERVVIATQSFRVFQNCLRIHLAYLIFNCFSAMAEYKTIFFCLLLLSIPLLEIEARKSGGGGGGSRGASGARTGSAAGGGGSFSPNRGAGSPNHGGGQNFGQQPNYGNRGGFNQQPNYGNRGGFNQQPHYNYPSGFQQQGWNRSPGFSNSGTGLGSASRGSTFKHALAGAAIGTIGGLLVFEAGKAIINSATTPFHHSGRDYYFDQQNYRGASNVPRCSGNRFEKYLSNFNILSSSSNIDQHKYACFK